MGAVCPAGMPGTFRKLTDSLSLTAEQAMDVLDIPAEERDKSAARLGKPLA